MTYSRQPNSQQLFSRSCEWKSKDLAMGVASYDNVNTINETNLLPSAEELQARIRLVEEKINKNK